jgi:Sulfotransferase family
MNPVFIVGAPRSGTTLLAAMLASHPAFGCGPETHFFARSTPPERQKALAGPWPESAIHLLSQLTLEGIPLLHLFKQDAQTLRELLASRPRRTATLLEVLTGPFASRLGKYRWVEKSPSHLMYVKEIAEAFPDAAIVRIVRDPRATAHSMTLVPFAGRTYLGNCVRWMNGYVQSRAFFQSPGRHYTLRYEDLVTDPEAELTRLCAFLGEDYDGAMLDYQDTARLLQTQTETWKTGTTRPLSIAGLHRWQKEVAPEDQSAAALFLKPALDEFGYPGGVEARGILPIFDLTGHVAEARRDLLTAAARAGVRVELLPEPPMHVRPLFASFDLRMRPRLRRQKAFLLRTLFALVRALARGQRPGYLTPIIASDLYLPKRVRLMATSLGRAESVAQALETAIPVSKQAARSSDASNVRAPGTAAPVSERVRA